MHPRNCVSQHLLLAASLTLSLVAVPGSAQQTAQEKTQARETQARPARGDSERREADDVRRRDEWFYRQRAFPLGRIPGGARQAALDRKEEMRRAQRDAQAAPPAASGEAAASRSGSIAPPGPLALSTTTWTHVGPMPTMSADPGVGFVAGRVSAIAVDPTNANVVFVGGAQGGVWKSTDGGTTWATTFDANKSLAIGAIAIDPSSCSPGPCTTIYVGTGEQNFSGDSYYGAGIYKSTDGGATWSQTTGTILNPQSGAPASFTGPFNEIVGGVKISSLVVHPAFPNKIFAGVQIFENVDGGISSGLYCSDDSGNTWTQLLSGAIGTDVQIHPASSGAVGYAALGSPNGDTSTNDTTGQNGIYKSAQANSPCTNQVPSQPGKWTLVSKAPVPAGTSAGQIRIGVALSDATANTVYAAVGMPFSSANPNGDILAGVFRTTDGGNTWATVKPPMDFCAPQCSYDLVVKVHPTDANTVFLGGSRTRSGGFPFYLLRTNSGLSSPPTWTQIAQDSLGNVLHVDQHALAFGFTGASVSSIYVGNDGGIWNTPLPLPGAAVAWKNLNNGLEMIQFYPGLSIPPANSQITYAGAQDNGTEKMDASFNPANPLEWNELDPCGDGGYTAIDPSNPTTVYAACENINIQKSTSSGSTGSFVSIDASINPNDRSEFIAPLVLDAANPQRLYFGTFRVWQTTNGGTSWSPISPDLTSGATDDITSISVSPVNPNNVFVGTFGSGSAGTFLQSTGNASAGVNATWSRIDNNSLPPRAITQVAADPNFGQVVYVTVSGFSGFLSGDTKGHVFRCSGVAPIGCTDISGNLPNIPVNCMVVDPADATSNHIYIGTDVGVFGTSNGGGSWTVDYPGFPNGLPNVAVLGMALHPASRILRVVTHGRGAWDLQLMVIPPVLSSLAPPSAGVGSPSLALTLTGSNFTVNSTVLFNGAPRTPTSTPTSTQITVTLNAADLATVGSFPVQVSDPVNGLSNILQFVVTLPAITSLSPTSAGVEMAGAPNLLLTVNGSGFNANSVVIFNGVMHMPASAPTATVITANLTPSDLSAVGNVNVTVATFGNSSNVVVFMVTTNFTMSANPTSATVTRGQSGMTTLSLAPVGGPNYPANVTFTCSGLPTESACNFNPATVMQNAGATMVTVMITTMAASPVPKAWRRGPSGGPTGPFLWVLAAVLLTGLLALRRMALRWRYASFVLLLAIFAGLAMSCGGGGGSSGGGNPGSMPLGANNLMIKATAGNVSQTVPFTLTLQ
jgi:photosystem II stability/assembly factor-like uncharacterized protein